jgi:inorganic pyrophosphatase
MSNTNINVFIEVSKNSNVKYMINPNTQQLEIERMLPYKFKYPFNYGYAVNTLNEDQQPMDVVIMLDEPLQEGVIIKCKIIGGIEYTDQKGTDYKLIVCPANDIDIRFKYINNITNLKPDTINKIRYFFNHYKDNLHVKVSTGKILNSVDATQLYNKYKI